MKKVIIITRDTGDTYHKDCKACKEFTSNPCADGEQKIHDYIKEYIMNLVALINNNEGDNLNIVWNNLSKTGVLPSFDIVWGRGTNKKISYDNQYDRYSRKYPNTSLVLDGFKERKISKILEKVLKPKQIDNKPYVSFTYKNDNKETYDVCFVFLNRIFDTFVNGSDQYGALVDDANRLGFIKAICQDCELIDKEGNLKGEKAILYIHDKEWYVSGAPYTAMQKGEYTKMAKSSNEKQEELKKFFDTIKVFLHIPSPFFDEITSLNFTEKDEELEILERKFW